MTVAKAQQDVAAIAQFAKNYFPILFNAYSSAASKGMEMVMLIGLGIYWSSSVTMLKLLLLSILGRSGEY